jgi:hypothetical protein
LCIIIIIIAKFIIVLCFLLLDNSFFFFPMRSLSRKQHEDADSSLFPRR